MLILNTDLEKIQYKEIVEMGLFKSPLFWLTIIVLLGFIGAYMTGDQEKIPPSKIVETNEK